MSEMADYHLNPRDSCGYEGEYDVDSRQSEYRKARASDKNVGEDLGYETYWGEDEEE